MDSPTFFCQLNTETWVFHLLEPRLQDCFFSSQPGLQPILPAEEITPAPEPLEDAAQTEGQ